MGEYDQSAPQPAYPAQPPETSSMAIASLVLGILGLILLFIIGPILAIVLGVKARRDIRRSEGRLGGQGLATAGLVLGIVGSALTALFVVVFAIATVGFMVSDGAGDRASDRHAQSSLRNTLTAAKVIFTDFEDYRDATVAVLQQAEPTLTFTTGSSTGPDEVSIDARSSSSFGAAALSETGTCFYITDDVTGPGTTFGSSSEGGGCRGSDAFRFGQDDLW